jgi:uncharacterized protein YfbU (UPF0304 family)
MGIKTMSPKTERFEMRLEQTTLDRVDAWRAKQFDMPSRADAIRRLIETGLEGEKKPPVKINDGERLILMMLRDMSKTLKVKGEIDPDFVAEAIWGGHYWGLEGQYTGLFHGHEDSRANLSEVVEILDMWSFLEEAYAKLSAAEKDRLQKEVGPLGKTVRFRGFDGNNESERLGIARFLIEKMERFPSFKGRDLNSHMPTTATYHRMLSIFRPIRTTLMGRTLGVSEIISILKEQIHPDHRKA